MAMDLFGWLRALRGRGGEKVRETGRVPLRDPADIPDGDLMPVAEDFAEMVAKIRDGHNERIIAEARRRGDKTIRVTNAAGWHRDIELEPAGEEKGK